MVEDDDFSDFECVDCSINTLFENEYYMVHDHVWSGEAGMDSDGGMLCIGCLEVRIGRNLDGDDFTDCRLNRSPSIYDKSVRLQDRLYS